MTDVIKGFQPSGSDSCQILFLQAAPGLDLDLTGVAGEFHLCYLQSRMLSVYDNSQKNYCAEYSNVVPAGFHTTGWS